MRSVFVVFFLTIFCKLCSVNAGVSTKVCGSAFDDVPSRTLLASIVLEGRARRFQHRNGSLEDLRVVFSHLKLYKGSLGGRKSLEVGYFSSHDDPEACIAPMVISLEQQYVLFLSGDFLEVRPALGGRNRTTAASASSGVIYRLSAFPVLSSRSVVKQVVDYTNCTRCGRPT